MTNEVNLNSALERKIPRGMMNKSYLWGRTFFRGVFASYFRWRVLNSDRIPSSGAVILAANHASYLDPPLVGCASHRPIHFAARENLFRFPLFGPLIRSWNAFPVDRDGGSAKGLRTILSLLNKQLVGVLIFPEGVRTHDGLLGQAQAGLGMIVIKSQAPVVPVRIVGSFQAFNRRHWIPRPKRLGVSFGHPMALESARKEAKSCSKLRLRELYSQVSQEVMDQISRLESPFPGKQP